MLKVGLPGVGLSSRKSLRLDINIYDNDIVLTVLSVESIFSHHQRSETVQVNCLFLSTDFKKTIAKCPGWMFNIYKPKIKGEMSHLKRTRNFEDTDDFFKSVSN